MLDYENYTEVTEYAQHSAYSGKLRKDFGKNEVEAREASRAKFEEQKMRMPREQVNVLEQIIRDNYENVKLLNYMMDRNSLELVKQMFSDLAELHEKVESLMKYAEKAQTGQVVYLSETPQYFGKINNNYFNSGQNPNKIDNDKLSKFIKEDSAFANYNGYMVASLHSMSLQPNQGDRILIPVELATGTRILHLGDGNVIIDKDIPMETREVTVVTYRGREIINWKLKQISQSRYKELISTAEQDLNKLIGEKFGIEDFNRIRFDFKSMRAATAMTRAVKAAQYMADTVPEQLFKKLYTTPSHISNTNFEISFIDREVDLHKEFPLGIYFNTTNKLHIYPVNVNLDAPADFEHFLTACTHEFAHALDYVVLYHAIASGDPSAVKSFSQTDEFKNLFDSEKLNLTEETSTNLYGQENEVEYFAEVFVAMFSKKENVRLLIKQQVPVTYRYITEHIAKITT